MGLDPSKQIGVDPIKQMADIWEKMLDDEGIDASDADNFYDVTSNLLHALTEHLRDRGLIASVNINRNWT